MSADPCHACHGKGYVLMPACCRRPVTVQVGDESVPYEQCCNEPIPERVTCHACNGTGAAVLRT